MLSTVFAILVVFTSENVIAGDLPKLKVSADKKGFVTDPQNTPFVAWGVNYDRDVKGRLLEDYWETEWPTVEAHFAQIKKLGANVIRVHLQVGKFLDGPDKPNEKSLDQLSRLIKLAEEQQLYLNLTGLGCYHKADVPAWYDKLNETERWNAQANFWTAVAQRSMKSPAIFCYDLMNEPIVPGGRREDGDWLGPAFGDKHFVQFITLDQANRPRHEIAAAWIHHLSTAIRQVDRVHLITVGLVDWSLDRPGLSSGFIPSKIADDLDFLCVHLYPEKDKQQEALLTLAGFCIGKPVVIEETFPLKCSPAELDAFIAASRPPAAGWFSFYWGNDRDELRRSKATSDAVILQWLDLFELRAKKWVK